jgi:hypothetical protein
MSSPSGWNCGPVDVGDASELAADHSVAAAGDVTITASGGGVAAGVVHGDVTPAGSYPAPAGPALAGPGRWELAAGSVAADRGATAIHTLQYRRRPEPDGMPVRLGLRPMYLAGREELLAQLDALLGAGP